MLFRSERRAFTRSEPLFCLPRELRLLEFDREHEAHTFPHVLGRELDTARQKIAEFGELAQRMLDNDVKPEIEIFDLAMLYNAANLVQQGLLKSPVHVQFVLGIPNSLPADREVLEFEIAQLKRVLPDATWTAAGVGRFQLVVNEWTLELGGHCRTG